MAEIKTPLIELFEGDGYVAGPDGAHVLTADHSNNDILRYIVADVGLEHVQALLNSLEV